ncbi:hypothetical protein EYF80_025461 [Liparis tanakae]|uniref:Uncharacterized protein n=1 Tax=Liparis tanakae TaxID=230148 RepID=A0A4Z2HFG1_9TELE|nr:hypothetical protein EYF80_025461 [Liparis tanakae]
MVSDPCGEGLMMDRHLDFCLADSFSITRIRVSCRHNTAHPLSGTAPQRHLQLKLRNYIFTRRGQRDMFNQNMN